MTKCIQDLHLYLMRCKHFIINKFYISNYAVKYVYEMCINNNNRSPTGLNIIKNS